MRLLAITEIKIGDQIKIQASLQASAYANLSGPGFTSADFGQVYSCPLLREESICVVPVCKADKSQILRAKWDWHIPSPKEGEL